MGSGEGHPAQKSYVSVPFFVSQLREIEMFEKRGRFASRPANRFAASMSIGHLDAQIAKSFQMAKLQRFQFAVKSHDWIAKRSAKSQPNRL